MVKIIALLSPVFATLFWALVLSGDRNNSNIPRTFLAKFMFLSFLFYTCKFFSYVPYPDVYIYFDVFYLYIGSLIYPIYHIYFRLLTVDGKFSWRVHSKYLILPVILVSIYEIGVLFTPDIEFKASLLDTHAFPNSPQVHFLNIMRVFLRIYFQIQLIVAVTQNYLLIRKYNMKAEQFYSDINDGKYNNAKKLNHFMIFTGVYTFFTYFFIKRYPEAIYVFPPIFAVIMYIIGYMGFYLKPLNPTYELTLNKQTESHAGSDLTDVQQNILDKLVHAFEREKIFLNSELNILDVVQVVGTNRTYISAIINQQYNQNFCGFVNSYRMEELERIIHENRDATNEVLAESCGFGSVNSLKRTVLAKTGVSITEWKKQLK
jgi:AraC-like DNA-binding protein